MNAQLYERAVYTRVGIDPLVRALASGDPIRLRQGTAWRAVQNWNAEARAQSKRTLVFLSDAASFNDVIAVGLLRNLQVRGRATHLVIEDVRSLREPLLIRKLRSARTGRLISSKHLRAYVPVVTPESVLKRGLDAIANSREATRSPDTWLLSWNPREASSALDDIADELANHEPSRWSCRANVRPGDRLFIMKVGPAPNGVVASGVATGFTRERRHWKPALARQGLRSRFVDLKCDRVASIEAPFDPRVLGRRAQGYTWRLQGSGRRIPEPLASALDAEWKLYHELDALNSSADEEPSAMEGAQQSAMRSHRSRERSLRTAKIRSVLNAGRRLACEVPGCGFVFARRYGKKAEHYIHVHHLKPLGRLKRSAPTRLSDLALVCANCHAVIHLGGGCLPLNDVLARGGRKK